MIFNRSIIVLLLVCRVNFPFLQKDRHLYSQLGSHSHSTSNLPTGGRNQRCGSVTFWYGSGYADPYLWLTDPAQAPDTFTSFFKDKKSLQSQKTVGIKVFLTIFAAWQKYTDSDPYLVLMNADTGGPKPYGSYGSGSVTLDEMNTKSKGRRWKRG